MKIHKNKIYFYSMLITMSLGLSACPDPTPPVPVPIPPTPVTPAAPVTPAPTNTLYKYDGNGRLLTATYSTGKTISYVYDAAGNITDQTVN